MPDSSVDDALRSLIREETAPLAEQVRLLTVQTRALTERLGTLTERVDTLTERLGTLTERVDTLAEQVGLLARVVEVGLATMRMTTPNSASASPRSNASSTRWWYMSPSSERPNAQGTEDVRKASSCDSERTCRPAADDYLTGLPATLTEWDSPEDEAAWRDL